MTTREDHAKLRAGRLTSSRAAAVLMKRNPNTWNTLLSDLWDEEKLIQQFTAANPEGSARAHGQIFEDSAIAQLWEDHPEIEMEDPKLVRFHDPDDDLFHWVLTSPDRVGVGQPFSDRPFPIEAKCPKEKYRFQEYQAFFNRRAFPDEHIPQCQWHSWVMNAEGTLLTIWMVDRPPLNWWLPADKLLHSIFDEHARLFVPHLVSGEPFAAASDSEINAMLGDLL